MPMTTLKDVAKDAGVSIATVSCCLSGTRPVKAETKARIMDSIERLSFVPNASARNLKVASTNRIGVILTDIDNAYHSEIFKGLSASLQNTGFTISVAFSNNSPEIECEKVDDFISQKVSGLIIITCQPRNKDFFQHRIKNCSIPTVFIEQHPDTPDISVSYVGFNNFRTTYFLTNELIRNGYRDIALITGPSQFPSESECMEGYKAAFIENNMSVNSDLMLTTNMSKEDSFKSVMTSISRKSLQAVIATSENIALGAYEALEIRGLKIPQNVQLITFSEERWNKSGRLPGVIHTSRTAFTLGTSAAELLVQIIHSPLLFEDKNIIFTDNIVQAGLHIPPADQLIQPSVSTKKEQATLNILMVDLPTSHSTELISSDFTQKTGIPIHFEYVKQDELLNRIERDVSNSRNFFDIYMYDIPWLGYMVQNALVSEITDFVDHSNFNPNLIFKEIMDNCLHENKYFGVPIIGGSQIMFYRKDLFENKEIIKDFRQKFKVPLRPPRTWTEFNGVAEFFTRSYNANSPTEYGTTFADIIDEELAPEILIRLWSYGGKLWDKHNRVSMCTPENVRAFHSILQTQNYVEHPLFKKSISQTISDFSSGKTAMLITYTEYASQINERIHANVSGRVGYEPVPGKTPVSVGWNFGLNPFTPKSDLAYQYFNWLCQHNTSYYMTILDGQSPVIAAYHSHELLKLYPWMELTEKSFEYCMKRSGPYRPKSLIIPQNKIESILCGVLSDILKRGLSVQEALELGQTKMELLFRPYGYPKPLNPA